LGYPEHEGQSLKIRANRRRLALTIVLITASWYGKQFHGKTTASGEDFDMFEFTAAHRKLPLGTFVKVTNLKNGKWIIVRINDRGPYVGNRIMDLSYSAARMLNFRDGVERIRIDLIQPQNVALNQGF
jgi:rare lipoprotein A